MLISTVFMHTLDFGLTTHLNELGKTVINIQSLLIHIPALDYLDSVKEYLD